MLSIPVSVVLEAEIAQVRFKKQPVNTLTCWFLLVFTEMNLGYLWVRDREALAERTAVADA